MLEKYTVAAPQVAVLGGGCFWCLEAVFLEMEGVLSVQSGYCGGRTEHPDYRGVCDGGTGHAEVVKITFDPQLIGFRDLLEVFFVIHDPTTMNRQGNDVGTQYRSVIFAQDEGQAQTARDYIEDLGEKRVYPSAIVTELKGAEPFWPAEDYHQSYFANNSEQPYCQYVVAGKVLKFREKFAARRKRPS